MLKSYAEMRNIDVKPHCEELEGFLYLNWARCVDLLHQNGATVVYWEPIPDPDTGTSLRMSKAVFKDKSGNENRCYETRIKVVIDDQVFEMQTPVLNGKNPVKDNSMNQLRVWTSMCRAFVKCVAIHTGLGFDLWLKEEMKPFMTGIPDEDAKPTVAQIKTIKDLCVKYKINLEHWLKSTGKTWDTLTANEAGAMLVAINEKYGE
jgi:hypothetical protein